MQIIKASYKETANSIQTKPTFGIDINPVGLTSVNKNKIPVSIAGTFYDLFSPDTSKKEERLKVEKELRDAGEKKTQTKLRSNPKNFYTFKALLKTYLNPLMDEVLNGYNLPKKVWTETALNNYFVSSGHSLSKHLKLKRTGINFEITLPLFEFNLLELSDSLDTQGDRGSSEQDDEIRKFKTNFWKRKLKLLPFNLEGEYVDETLDKIMVNTSVDKGYPKAKDFYKKYVRNFKITTKTKMPVNSNSNFTGNSRLALPAPENNFDNSKALRVLPTVTRQENTSTEFEDRVTGEAILKADFIISAVVILPYTEACFYVQSEHPKEVEVLDFIHSWYGQAMKAQGSSAYPTYKHSMVGVREKNKNFAQFAKPKTNGDKVAMTKANKLIYLPDVDLIDKYRQALTDATFDTETQIYSFDHKPNLLPKSQLIYVDWVNSRVAYTTADAKLNTLDLSVVYPVSAVHYLKELNTHFDGAVTGVLKTISAKAQSLNIYRPTDARMALTQAYELAKQYNDHAAGAAFGEVVEYTHSGNWESALYKFYNVFTELVFTPAFETAESKPFDIQVPVLIKDVLKEPFFKPLQTFLYNLFTAVFNTDDTILSYINNTHKPVPDSLYELAFMLPFRQIQHYSKLLEVTANELDPYLNQDKIDINEPTKIKNFEGVEILMHHQGKALKKLNKKPKFAIIAAQAGGGKTLTAIADILDNLESKTVKKPLVLCPNGLIKDYINEANFASKGKLNVVPFDTTVFNNYANIGMDKDGNVTWDYTKLKALVDNAPINTIFVLGYDVITASTSNKIMNVYGNAVFESYSHLEFFASCKFDGVWADESHYLKGSDSLRVAVNEILIVPIPIKRLLTGTIAPNNLTDLVPQMMLFDPSILGTETQFRRQFDIENRPKGIFSPHPEAYDKIVNLLKQQCTFINIQRKEWAAILPELHEYTAQAYLTPNQTMAYKLLINDAVDVMEATLTEEERAALQAASTSEEDDEKIEKIFERTVGNLSAVEAFLANPSSIKKEYQEMFLKNPEDYISPKGSAVLDIIKMHLAEPNKYVGKILVFCNTHAAVAGVWNALPPEIKNQTIYYSAKKKADYERQFKTDSTKKILLGVSDSLDTGLNLQIADTIIRVDCVWTPGKLEQGNARVNRPSLKEKDANGNRYDVRKENGLHIYYIMVDRTIDTLKYSKLTSKTVALAKFYNAGTKDFKKYEKIGIDEFGTPIEPVRVSFELLRQGLSWDEMESYKLAYEQLRQAESEIYKEYAALNPEELAPVIIEHDGIIEGSKVLRNVPYVAGAGIFNDDQLGLVPYLVFKQEFITQYGIDSWNPEGLLIHTELGEGTVIKETSSTVHLKMNDSGIRSTPSPSVIFVVTKKSTSTMEIRDQLVTTTGLEGVDIQLDTYRNELRNERKSAREEKEKLADDKRVAREAKRAAKEREIEERKNRKVKISPVEIVEEDDSQDDDEDTSLINIKFTPINEMLGLTLISDDPHSEIKMFKKYGFVVTKPYLAAEIKRVSSLDELLNKMEGLQQKGIIDMSQDLWDMWANIEHEFSQSRSKLLQVNQTPKSEITNFLKTNYRRVRTPSTIRALPLIMDNKLYMVIDLGSHDTTTVNKVRRLAISGVTWTVKDAELLGLYTNKASLANAIKLIKDDGWTIENEDEIKHLYSRTKIKSVK